MDVVENEVSEQQENFSDISAVLGTTRHQILAAQFECYLKIISDPPRTEEGGRVGATDLFTFEWCHCATNIFQLWSGFPEELFKVTAAVRSNVM